MTLTKKLLTLGLCLVFAGAASAAGESDASKTTRKTLALSYPEGKTLSVKFGGTWRLPDASGEAKVERKKGSTEIEIELDELKPAGLFGGDFNTYVLWSVSPEGQPDNLGEFILEGNRSKLNVSTNLSTFAMLVTAEPHFLVESPSPFIVLENTRPTKPSETTATVSEIHYSGSVNAYRFERESLAGMPEGKGEIRAHLQAARTAVGLAERAGAEAFAPDRLTAAQKALDEAEASARAGLDNATVTLKSHEAVRLAVTAEKDARAVAFEQALNAEREAKAEQLRDLETRVREAKNEAERAEAEADQRQLRLEMERRAHAEAIHNAQEAATRAQEAERRAERARNQANQAALAAEEARQASAEARRKMTAALGEVASIRETARGLIVNLPDILFDFGRASLRPEARETLSKVAGILLVSQAHSLRVEGHTDDVGSVESNRTLSLRRAEAVRDYLVQSGVPSELIATEGFGQSQPLAPNTTPENRQKNRRVEIVIEPAPNPLDS